MICEKNAKRFCSEPIERIENYSQAIADGSQSWDCHHRGEILPCGTYSAKTLQQFNLYFHRPASELVFLPHSNHTSLHNVRMNKDRAMKCRVSKMGNKYAAGKKNRLGTHSSEETRMKLSELNRGEKNNMFGKHHSNETRRKLSEMKMGMKWWHKGDESKMSKDCPGEGWERGRK